MIFGESSHKEFEKVILCDFDGTIIKNTAKENILDERPLEGVKTGLMKLTHAGYTINIWSCRTSQLYSDEFRKEQKHMIEMFLDMNEILYDEVLLSDKPFAVAYIDACSLKPDWPKILSSVKYLECEIRNVE